MSIADPPHRVWLSWDQELAERWARQKQCDYNSQLVVVPLYRQPPQPRGWLTGEEKAAIRWAMSEGFDEDVFRNLLARSTPPKVRLPLADLGDRLLRDSVIHALAEAGVAVADA